MSADYCHYSEEQVRESGLLSPERMAEVSATIDTRISLCYDSMGSVIPGAKLADCGPKKGRLLFARFDYATAEEYMRREVMFGVLTDAELTLINDQCMSAQSAAREAERFAKAEKVDAWDGGAFLGDDYFVDMDELCDRIVSDGDEWPEYVWASKPTTVFTGASVADVVESAIADSGWEDMDEHDFNGTAELQAALDKFTEANKSVVAYYPDYSKAILMTAWKAASEEVST
jgi:hypothetical protein